MRDAVSLCAVTAAAPAPVFPITSLLPDIVGSLAAHPRLVLEAPPGAGKTTQVPLALLHADWLQGRRIVMLEPRRVAARSAAMFMARQLGEDVGGTVGYRIRFENRVSARTRIEVVTEGILTRMLQDDPELCGSAPGGSGPGGVGALLFDEFHERHLAGDLGLALACDVQAGLREDLRIVVMSATLDGERIAQWLGAPRLSSAGRSFPVDIAHVPARRDEELEHQVRRVVVDALDAHPGDVLVFLPGQREIARCRQLLESALAGREKPPELLALHGELPVEAQAHVLQPAADGRRRVVLATNVAESSVTLPGVRIVVDSGLAREPRFDPNSGFSRLDLVAIAQASADQRAGRAGRVAPGVALRLWPQSQRLEPQRRPEIAQVDLAALALELAAWGDAGLRFPDPPPPGALAAARDLLRRLGAFDAGDAITPVGRRMLGLGTHPRLAAMLLAADTPTAQALACDLCALVEARDPLRPLPGAPRSDALAARWQALAAFRAGRTPADAQRGALAAIDAAAKQWRRRLRSDAAPPRDAPAHALGDLLVHAFPDRIGHRHARDPYRYPLSNGRMARLFDDSTLVGEPWIVASELRFDAKDALLLRGAPVDEARLRATWPQRFSDADETRWDAGKRALVGERVRRFDGIVLDAVANGRVDPAQAAQALTDAVGELGLEVLPWRDGLRQWRARVQGLRAWMPELGLPDLSDAMLLDTRDRWLRPAFAGCTRLDALDAEHFAGALHGLLDWSQRQQLDRLAPVRIVVPSGQARAIDYTVDADGAPQPPVLAVKLQELFGLAQTPAIADGRVPLTIHLLSPAGRPLQVTRDLRGFWERTYPEVRKEMKGRYPKHPWPDDPWNAVATHRAKPRGT
ncbi:ATP-dependent helicase HrpB [Luteimonas sp. BDR2-5]|uniref:ATP-dependent helicase HrpB n=1 Tax=Proluteimonas luteida TaxID=2878685 RepID=UPI001E470F06|nr:ATP-dependent helicase HrpB [Luteimonas sp. BDR2-5]MCD9027816.1 ATP-dependent helicase HrpB [Luteimonas sp. BDR2-5]